MKNMEDLNESDFEEGKFFTKKDSRIPKRLGTLGCSIIEGMKDAVLYNPDADEITDADVHRSFSSNPFEDPIYIMNTIHRYDYPNANYLHLSKKEREANIQPVRSTPKIGRNEICGCGSGKKYKNCCLNKKK